MYDKYQLTHDELAKVLAFQHGLEVSAEVSVGEDI